VAEAVFVDYDRRGYHHGKDKSNYSRVAKKINKKQEA
jgi:hypothetical protein